MSLGLRFALALVLYTTNPASYFHHITFLQEGHPATVGQDDARKAMQRGEAALDIDDFVAAQRAFLEAVAILEKTAPNSLDLAKTYSNLGLAVQNLGNLAASEEWYKKGLAIQEVKAIGSLDLAATYNNLGVVSWSRGDLAAAEGWFKKALPIRETQDPGSLGLAAAYNNLGAVTSRRGDLSAAEEWFKKALTIQEAKEPGSLGLARVYNNLGGIAVDRGELDVAEALFKKALPIREAKEPGSLGLAGVYNNLGKVRVEQGDLDGAEAWHKMALSIREEKAPGSLDLARSYVNLGSISVERGDLDAADAWYRKALTIQEAKAPGSLDLSITYHNLGAIAEDSDSEDAWYQKALTIQEAKAPGSLDLALSYNNQGARLRKRGDLDAAEAWHRQALKIQEVKAPGSLAVATTFANLGVVASRRGELEAAEAWYKKALSIREAKAPGSLELAGSFNGLGVLAWQRGDLIAAEAWHRKALSIRGIKAPASLTLAGSYHNLGIVALYRRDLDAAEEWSKKAIAIEEVRSGGSLGMSDSYSLRGTIAVSRGNYVEARKSFELASRINESHRSKLLAPESRSLFQRSVANDAPEHLHALVKLEDLKAVALLLESSKSRGVAEVLSSRGVRFDTREIRTLDKQLDGTYEALGEEADAVKARGLRDRIASLLASKREAENAFRKANPKLASLAYPVPLDLASIQKALGPGTLALHYVVGEDYGYVVAIAHPQDMPAVGKSPAGIRAFKIDVNSKALASKISALSLAIQRGGGITSKPGFELSSLLIKPVESLINGRKFKRLVICPNGPLNTLTFAALPLGSGKYLADVVPITVVSSITTLKQIREGKRGVPSVPMLAFGDPIYSNETDGDSRRTQRAAKRGLQLSRLVNTGHEARAVSALYKVRPLLREAATVSALKKNAGRARIVHIASHGLLDPVEPMASSLALTREKEGDGLLQAYEVMRDLQLSADLVVLSACETGLGKSEGNEGISGLTRAFQYAGAKSVLVSLWSVDDKSTSEFMQLFYKALKSGTSKDIALQAAQKGLRKKYASPYYWAPFILVGDWR